jgi:hypothetical protein
MSLQDAEKENLLRAFYRERLLPLAESAKTAGAEIIPLGANPKADSYYLERSDDGNYVHEINSGDLAGELKDLWTAGKHSLSGLAELAEEIVALAETLREDEDTSEEVSPFIYAMF